MERFYNLVPILLSVPIVWLLKPSWWAAAMITGGMMFAWDWLWGDRRLLDGRYGLTLMAVGVGLVIVSFALAVNIGISLAEFVDTAKGMPRRERHLYLMPVCGVGIVLYRLLIFSISFADGRENRN